MAGAITLDYDKAQNIIPNSARDPFDYLGAKAEAAGEVINTTVDKTASNVETLAGGILNALQNLGSGVINFGGFIKNHWKILLIAAVALIVIKR